MNWLTPAPTRQILSSTAIIYRPFILIPDYKVLHISDYTPTDPMRSSRQTMARRDKNLKCPKGLFPQWPCSPSRSLTPLTGGGLAVWRLPLCDKIGTEIETSQFWCLVPHGNSVLQGDTGRPIRPHATFPSGHPSTMIREIFNMSKKNNIIMKNKIL